MINIKVDGLLADLKPLLLEHKQNVPPISTSLERETDQLTRGWV